jgi:hypothetical protein
MNLDGQKKAALEEHRQASERGDGEIEYSIYGDDAFLDYPQSGERFRGRDTIAAQRDAHPANRHFTVLRIVGAEDLWVGECLITCDGVPSFSVSVMGSKIGMWTTRPNTSPAYSVRLIGGQRSQKPMPGREITRA